MAKIHKNAQKFPIEWNGKVVGGEKEGDCIPSTTDIIWGNNPYTWGDVQFVQEVVDGLDSLDDILLEVGERSNKAGGGLAYMLGE